MSSALKKKQAQRVKSSQSSDDQLPFAAMRAQAKQRIAKEQERINALPAEERDAAWNAFIATANPWERAELRNEFVESLPASPLSDEERRRRLDAAFGALKRARITVVRRSVRRPIVRRVHFRVPRRRSTSIAVSSATRSTRSGPSRPRRRPRRKLAEDEALNVVVDELRVAA